MRLGLSLCGTCNCGAPVLLVGVFFPNVEFMLYRGRTVLCALVHNKLKSFVWKNSIFTRPWVFSNRRVQLRQQHGPLECIHDAADGGINSAGIIFLLNNSISGYQSQTLTELISYGMRGITYLWFNSYLLFWKQFVEIMQNDSRNSVQKKNYFFS